MRREFYFQDDRSNKFWTVEVTGKAVVTTNGRIGAKPREVRHEFATAAAAEKEASSMVASKLKKGYIEGKIKSAPKYAKPDWSAMTMSEEVFWRIMGLFDWKKVGDDDAVIEPAIKALAQMKVSDIQEFAEMLAEKLYAVDTEAHAREIGDECYKPGKYFSVDWFLYVRCTTLTNGPEFYKKVLADPREMPKDVEFETLLYVPSMAYERKTGNEFEYTTRLSYETYSNRTGWRNKKKRPK